MATTSNEAQFQYGAKVLRGLGLDDSSSEEEDNLNDPDYSPATTTTRPTKRAKTRSKKETKIAKLTNKINKTNEIIEMLEQKLAEKDETNQELQTQINTLQQQVNNVRCRLEYAVTDLNNEEDDHKEQCRINVKLNEQIEIHKKHCEVMSKQVKKYKEENEQLRFEKARRESELATEREALIQTNNQFAQTNHQLAKVFKNEQELQTKVNKLTQQLQEMYIGDCLICQDAPAVCAGLCGCMLCCERCLKTDVWFGKLDKCPLCPKGLPGRNTVTLPIGALKKY